MAAADINKHQADELDTCNTNNALYWYSLPLLLCSDKPIAELCYR